MRSDLLHYLELLAAGPERRIGRAERWRHRSWTTHAVVRASEAVAARLVACGIGGGDRVGLFLADGPLWVAGFFGILRTGAVAVPLDVSIPLEILRSASTQLELEAWITETEVPRLDLDATRLVMTWNGDVFGPDDAGEAIEPTTQTDPTQSARSERGVVPWPDDDAERISQIVLTSGTSGTPQAVPVLHRNLRAVLDPVAGEIDKYRAILRLLPAGRIGVSLPLSHLYGQVMGIFIPALFHAHTTMIPTLPGAELAQRIRDERISVLSTVPRTLALLARTLVAAGELEFGAAEFHRRLEASENLPWYKRPRAFASIRKILGRRFVAVVCGGAALDRDVEDVWRRLGYVVVQGYGLTEAAPMVTLNHPLHTRAGSLGKPLHGVQVEIAADGEIFVRGANVVPARLGGAAVDDGGWLHTGDLGRKDDDGRLYYLGRKGDRIVTPAGVNVDPGPMIATLRQHPDVSDALVLERPWGGRGVIAAVLVVRPGGNPALTIERTNAALPDAARIREWRVWPGADFPRTHTEKVKRPEVRAWLVAQAPDKAAVWSAPGGGSDGAPAVASNSMGSGPTSRPVAGPAITDDPFAAVAHMIADITGEPSNAFSADTPVVDALTSLDRVELASMLEAYYGLHLSDEAFAGEKTLGDLANELTIGEIEDGRGTLALELSPTGTTAGNETDVAVDDAGDTAATAQATTGGTTAADRGPISNAGARTADDRAAHVQTRINHGERSVPPAAVHQPFPAARWRTAPWARAARFVIREGVMHPGLHCVVDLKSAGSEHVSAIEPPFLLASNHLSIMDPVCLMFALPASVRARVASTAMWKHFELSPSGKTQLFWSTLGLNLIPLVQVGDWRPTLRLAGQLADQGYCPLIFPEGERSADGSSSDFKLGAAVLAQNLHLPIIPCAIAGLLAVLPKGATKLQSGPIPRPRVAVHFGPAMPAPGPADDPAEIIAELKRRIDALRESARHEAGRW